VFVFSPKVIPYIPRGRKSDFEKDVLPLLLHDAKDVYAYHTNEYLKDMGTPERLERVNNDYITGKFQNA
jgi:NDP-sugar pyrophosphorylase family protein